MSITQNSDIPEGHVGNLTAEQVKKLQEAWLSLGTICGVEPVAGSAGSGKGGDVAKLPKMDSAADQKEDKYGQSKEFRDYVDNTPSEQIRQTMWDMVRMDHPDALVLRFLRARKWDVGRAVVMLLSTVQWRASVRIDDTIIPDGDAVALRPEAEQTEDDRGFLLQWRSGKAYVRGLDVAGRPVVIIRVKKHRPGEQTDRAMERFILHMTESIRLLVRDPHDTACLIFDLTDFSLRNMDFAAVRFIIHIFEARYPETLGQVLVHAAPWAFQAVWRLIRPLLDPVVAAKIVFTRGPADMWPYVPRASLQADYGGADPWRYSYVEPAAADDARMADTAARDAVRAERDAIVRDFEAATARWVAADPDADAGRELARQRADAAARLRDNYWKLDPYVRARNFYDRTGVLGADGVVNFSRP